MHMFEDNSLLKMLGMTASRLESYANRMLFEPSGLTISCAKILHLLELHGPQTPTNILKNIGGTKSNVTQRLNLLERQGLIKRAVVQGGDKRSVSIEMTENGKRRFLEIAERMTEGALMLDQQFSEAERFACISVLKKINSLLDDHKESTCTPLCKYSAKN